MACTTSSNAKEGSKSLMGYENSKCSPTEDPYGTALDLASTPDPKICCLVTENFSVETLEAKNIGCGGTSGFGTDYNVGNPEYRVGLSGDLGFQNGFDRLLAQFMGAAAAPTASGTGFSHLLTFDSTPNKHFGTFVYETTKTDVVELKSTYVEELSVSMDSVGKYVSWDATLLGNAIEIDSTLSVNDNASLAGLTFGNKELILPKCTDSLLLKRILDDGTDTALSALTDLVKITGFDLNLSIPLQTIKEMTGGDCSAPTVSGKRSGTLTLRLKEHTTNNFLSYKNWLENHYFACSLQFLGTSLGSGQFQTFRIKIPKMVIKESPKYNLQESGVNPYTLTFEILDSLNVQPTFAGVGMEVLIKNKRSARYLVP